MDKIMILKGKKFVLKIGVIWIFLGFGFQVNAQFTIHHSFSCRDVDTEHQRANHFQIYYNDNPYTPTSIQWYVNGVPVSGNDINCSTCLAYAFPSSGNYTVSALVNGTTTVVLSGDYPGIGVFEGLEVGYMVNQTTGVYTFIYQGSTDLQFYYDLSLIITDLSNNGSIVANIPVNLGSNTGNGAILETFSFNALGTYSVTLKACIADDICCTGSVDIDVTVVGIGDECCSNFAPIVNEEYWLAAWVQEEVSPAVKTYSNSYVELEFVGSNAPNLLLYPSGDLVEGWQRIVGKFTIPANTTDLKIHLVNNRPSGDVYFDDVRVHPFNASMKSYVYDPETLWLTAELDDNNYATFYEYDGEGQLVRMKKETARGIMTIQESRSSNPKE